MRDQVDHQVGVLYEMIEVPPRVSYVLPNESQVRMLKEAIYFVCVQVDRCHMMSFLQQALSQMATDEATGP